MDSLDLPGLIDLLDLEQIEVNMFRGKTLGGGFVFGGQVLGQALVAAARTVEAERKPHSMHAYFLRPGDSEVPILFEVDRIRDGKSFTTRRVVAIQNGKAIFNMSVSFQVSEEGLEHQFDMPNVLGPESLQSDRERFDELIKEKPEFKERNWTSKWPFDLRHVEWLSPGEMTSRPPFQHVWIRLNGDAGEDQILQRAMLAFASDMGFMATSMLPHGRMRQGRQENIQGASLDHSLWFHEDIKMNEWLLYQQESPWAASSRGYVRGAFYTRSGELVASAAQECLIRIRETPT